MPATLDLAWIKKLSIQHRKSYNIFAVFNTYQAQYNMILPPQQL